MQAAADSSQDRAPATARPVVDRPFALAAGLALAATCAVLWLAGWQTQGWISAWPRFQDDAYYYLVIAQNAAGGHGFTMDRLSPTNGFQPLWMWTLVPVAWLSGSDPAVFLGVVQVLSVALVAAVGGVFCGLLRARLGLAPALLAGLLIVFPRFLNVLVSGLESGLVFLVLVALIVELLRRDALSSPVPRAADARTGALVGLLLLARLDTVFIGLALAGFVAAHGLMRGTGGFAARIARTVRKELALFWPTVALVTPYLVWNQLAFGHLMPISGALKTSFPQAGFTPEHMRVEYAGLLLLGLGAAGREIWRGNGRDPLVRGVALLSIGLVFHALYTVMYMHWAVFSWHFAAFIPVGILGAAMLASDAARRAPRVFVIGALAGLALFQVFALAFSVSRLALSFTVAGREAGAWVAANLPADAVLGMKDSGAFSYFAQRRVMNLDGVANSFEFANALCHGGLEDFMRSHGVEYVAQHSVPPEVRAGAYERFTQTYRCHLPGGRDASLELRRDLEVFRGTAYIDEQAKPDQLLIWRLPDASAPATPAG